MVHLQDLPPELLHRVLSFISDPEEDTLEKHHECDGTKDLYSLCLVSRQFRELAQPLLFRNFDGDNTDGHVDDDHQDDIENLVRFIRAIYQRPALGEHVRFVSLDPIDPEPDDVYGDRDPEPFRDAIRQLKLGKEEKKWMAELEKNNVFVYVALLLVKTPNLRALRVPHGTFLLSAIATLRERDPSLLSNLEQIWITCDNDEVFGYDIAQYHEFITLPKMKAPTFEYGDLIGAKFPSITAGTLAAEELAFSHCHIDTAAIKKLFTACKRVKSFTYQTFTLDPVEDRSPSTSGTTEFNAAEAHAAVLLHKDTLEHFHLEYFRDPLAISSADAYQAYCASQPKIPSFRDFPVLETLFIQHALLPAHPRFPPSLQRLDITDCNSSIRDMVSKIATDVKYGDYPRLREFRVLTLEITRPIKLAGQRIPQGQTPEQCFLSLQASFKGTKVEFQIFPYRMPNDEDDYDEDSDYPYEYNYESFDPQELLGRIMMAVQDPAFAASLAGAANGDDDDWSTDDEA
ncbi:hypothetical protein BJX61DRAFT_455737 [Aspergillus egyptiacus]|nr:hypothetical protein BJX61DRAFT_455737 [Aspergillus egyptiacus]